MKALKGVPMFIRNTSQYPTDEVEKLVRFAANRHHRRVCVNVKNSGDAYRGAAYNGVPSISNAPQTARYLITVCIGDRGRFPIDNYYSVKFKRVSPCTLNNWQEALVFVTAHEMSHVRQYVLHKRCSEVDAEKRAIKTLMRFRGGDNL
jgi:hypothetical protein